MIAFEPFRSSVPKLPYISNTPHLQVYPTVVRDGHQPVPRFVINVRSALVRPPGVRGGTSPAARPSLLRDVTGAFWKDSFLRD
ncbi:MAG: hypothetical protein AUI91_03500 [Acidobacteria bacterium 13_1_40CM_3_56_11]|nr:MAG: hypothetical protein AUH28_03790 [Acidobacteria bacterium 13_1_40CM_56_16]OLD21826.1 MAG: hypothetical protein AUI91_03500 [Acidobacteria bacterium 13_1_40CM_3_56_11]